MAAEQHLQVKKVVKMVQIISPSPLAMQKGQIGESIGIGLSKKLGLDEAERLANSAENDPVKLAFALARASNAAPGLERSLGQIYQAMLDRGNSKGLADSLSPNDLSRASGNMSSQINNNQVTSGEITPRGDVATSMDTPSNTSWTPSNQLGSDTVNYPDKKHYNNEDIKSISSQYVMDNRPDLIAGSTSYGRVPTFNFEAQSDLRPEEEGQIRQNLIAKGKSPKVIDQVIETARNDIKARYNEKLQSQNMDAKRQAEINAKWNDFSKDADANLLPLVGKYSPFYGFGGKPKTANDLKNKYFQYASELPVNLTPQQMHAQAGTMLQRDINRIDALSAIPPLPYVRDPKDVEENVKDRKEAYKQLAKEGYTEALKENAIIDGGMGLEEFHMSLWGDQTDKGSLNSVGSLKAPVMYLEGKPVSLFNGQSAKEIQNIVSSGQQKQKSNPNYSKEREMYVTNLSERLSKIKPEDDLILLKAQALNAGAQEKDFNDALEMATEKKGFKLSPFQNSQLQEVRIPREPPMWQIFNPKAWEKWINYSAGKR